jgi:transcriptional regulator with XRE-family HTH domain
MTISEKEFKVSRELRLFFVKHFERWKEKNSGTLQELADKCGVSPSYLSQIGRYGRVPGRPVLLLLAFNFQLEDPAEIFRVCGISAEWPYRRDVVLGRHKDEHSSFLSLRVDMPALAEAVAAQVKRQLSGSISASLYSREPLRIGVNPMQGWFIKADTFKAGRSLFEDLCNQLGLTLQRGIKLEMVPFAAHVEHLVQGEQDLYGPVMASPVPRQGVIYSTSLFRVAVVGVQRLRDTEGLEHVAPPKKLDDLRNESLRIAVLRNALPHLLLNSRFGRADETLVLCDSDEEAAERILLKGIRQPAHLFLCNALFALHVCSAHPKELALVFDKSDGVLEYENTTIAMRPEWRTHEEDLNRALGFLLHQGGFKERIENLFNPRQRSLISFDAPPRV